MIPEPHMNTISRRGMLKRSLLAAAATEIARSQASADETSPDPITLARRRLRSIMPTRASGG